MEQIHRYIVYHFCGTVIAWSAYVHDTGTDHHGGEAPLMERTCDDMVNVTA